MARKFGGGASSSASVRERLAGVDRLSYAALTASKLGPSELDALSGCESFAAFKYAALTSS